MNDEFKLNFAIGAIRGLYAQDLITGDQMNLAINNLKSFYEKDIDKEAAARRPHKEEIGSDKSSRLL